MAGVIQARKVGLEANYIFISAPSLEEVCCLKFLFSRPQNIIISRNNNNEFNFSFEDDLKQEEIQVKKQL